MSRNIVHLCDCMEFMKGLPDKAFDLGIVDPPYGLGDRLCDGAGKLNDRKYINMYRQSTRWDAAPDKLFFLELFRVSKNQIIWGGNYFDLPPTRCVLCWDKLQDMPTLSAWEMGWTSFDKPTKIFKHLSQDSGRIHPTQKPVALYKWLLRNYAKPGQSIIDTHVGSGSSRIACYDLGFDFEGCELDPDYHRDQEKRYQGHIAQGRLFEPEQIETKNREMF